MRLARNNKYQTGGLGGPSNTCHASCTRTGCTAYCETPSAADSSSELGDPDELQMHTISVLQQRRSVGSDEHNPSAVITPASGTALDGITVISSSAAMQAFKIPSRVGLAARSDVLCPDGSNPVDCLTDPCLASNPCATDEFCMASYCGGEAAAATRLQCT